MFSALLFSIFANAAVKCDSQNQFKDFILPPQDHISLVQQMIAESKAQQKAIDKLTQAKTKNAYEAYMNSDAGKKSVAKIEALKGQLNYDAVSYYLFDNPSFNADVEPYDAKVVLEGKGYYLRQGQIVAILEPDQMTWILRRFDKDCRQKEAVGFTSMDVSDESHLDYKINPQLCSIKAAKTVAALKEDQIEKVNAMINTTVEDADAIRLRNRQIEAQCRLMTTPAAKKKGSDAKKAKTSS
jgi:hypothetical protein